MKYVLILMGRNAYTRETVATEDVTGAVDDLTTGLRPWALAHLRNRDNGWYSGYLVTTDEDGSYDTYDALSTEDVIWYWGEECAPVTERHTTTRPPARL